VARNGGGAFPTESRGGAGPDSPGTEEDAASLPLGQGTYCSWACQVRAKLTSNWFQLVRFQRVRHSSSLFAKPGSETMSVLGMIIDCCRPQKNNPNQGHQFIDGYLDAGWRFGQLRALETSRRALPR
jgi:hypothetical protein